MSKTQKDVKDSLVREMRLPPGKRSGSRPCCFIWHLKWALDPLQNTLPPESVPGKEIVFSIQLIPRPLTTLPGNVPRFP